MAKPRSAQAALGLAVREARTERGISQEELAHRAGVHRTYVGGIERGERNPTVTSIFKLADALELRASELISRAEALRGRRRG